MNCFVPGFGSGIYGKSAWGGSLDAIPGGPIPIVDPFDVYCVGPCGPIAELLTYDEVDHTGDPLQFPVDSFTLDQLIVSGGASPDGEAELDINTSVPEDFTLEFTVEFASLPNDFTDLINSHAYIGASDAAGSCAALFFSKIGLLYTGCAHYDGTQLVVDTVLQPLENSQLLVSENEYWTIRIACSTATGATYIYVTRTAELLSLGHQLRYILPSIPSNIAAITPPDRTLILVRGTASAPTFLSLDSICLGFGLIIPNIAPIADPGSDQAVQLCEVLRLDGSRSFDPEGGALTYKWRLVDAPPPSQYSFIETDGTTHPGSPPTGFTDRFYSVALSVLDGTDPISVGDVLVVGGVAHTLQSKGSDIDGFFVRIEGFTLPDNLTLTAFTLLRQRGLNTATDQKPTFYPDVPGIYKFDLTVFDGGLFSFPESIVINVTESAVARGCTPDLSFVWGYLSDFWRLVEDRERVEIFWQALAQVTAAELLSLWQIDYSKSLRDVQRTFQRRWLHYDLLMQEDPAVLEESTVRAILGGVSSLDIATAGIGGVQGTHLDLQIEGSPGAWTVSFLQANPYTAAQLQVYLQASLAQIDPRFTVQLIEHSDGLASTLRIDAPFPFTVLNTTTFPAFSIGFENVLPSGTGAGVGIRTYRTDRSLQFLDIQQNDFLCVDGVAYRIARIVDDVSDPLPFMRVVVLDDLPITVGTAWALGGTVTSTDLDFWSGLCEQDDVVVLEVLQAAGQQPFEVTCQVLASSSVVSKSLACDLGPVGIYLSKPDTYSVFLKSVLRRKYVPIDPLIVDVPYLQEFIVSKDDTQVLRRNVDYFIETFRDQPCIRFMTPVPANIGGPDVWEGLSPPDRLWAETSYLDNKPRIEANFGIPAEFTLDDLATLPSNVDYLSSVRGLWYAYFNGPTLFNLRAGVQILLGLPFAEESGIIVEIRNDFSDTTGRILVQDLANQTITRSYTFPKILSLETNPATGKPYTVSDTVQQFAPLVTGVEVVDYVKDPTWYGGYLNQGVFFEVEKFFKFLVRVDSAAFNLSALLFVQTFIRRIKPTYTFPLFVVLASVPAAEVSVTDDVTTAGRLILFEGAGFRTSLKGAATLFDDPRAAGGGWRSRFDSSSDPSNPPAAVPDVTYPVGWAFDKEYLAPEDAIVASFQQDYDGIELPSIDSPLFYVDATTVFNSPAVTFASGPQDYIPASGLVLGLQATAPASVTYTTVRVEAYLTEQPSPATYNVIVKKNGSTVATVPFTLNEGHSVLDGPISVAVTMGDTIDVLLVSTTGADLRTLIGKLMVTAGSGVAWAIDTPLPAGTYYGYRIL